MHVDKAEIFISRIEQVLAVPLAALYTVGRDSYVFVRSEEGVKERKVQIETANETHVQIVDGLTENEQVLLLQPGQGRMLLEKAGVKFVEQPTTRPSAKAGKNRGAKGGSEAKAVPQAKVS